MAKERLYFNGIAGKVFDVEVIKGFIHIKYLKYFFDETTYQREIDAKHVKSIVNFIDNPMKDYKIFPEIIVTLPESQYLDEAEIKIHRGVIKSYGKVLSQIEFKDLDKIKDKSYCQIVDGNHRVKAFLQSDAYNKSLAENENYQIPVSFVNINSKIEGKAFFYYLNSKSKRLLSTDYFNYLEEEPDVEAFKKIDDEIYYFKIIFDELKDLSDDENFSKYILEFSNYLVEIFNCDVLSFMIRKDSEHLSKIISFFKENFEKLDYKKVESKINMLKLTAFLLSKELEKDKSKYSDTKRITTKNKNPEDIAEEVTTNENIQQKNKDNLDKDLEIIKQTFEDFREWLKSSNLEAEELNNLHAIEVLYKIFKNTYKPKRNKIFLSMPFDRETELTYFAVKETIRKLNDNHHLGIEELRIDKHNYPTSDYIPQTVYKEIENSGLMIADLTGNNRNVYNEIGYKTALDKDLVEPKIILIHNTASYYDENAKKYNEKNKDGEQNRGKQVNCESDDTICEYKIKVKELKDNDVGFNISAISQIRFKDTEYLQDRLYAKLYKYFTDYKPKKR